jgi:hypothetical protein
MGFDGRISLEGLTDFIPPTIMGSLDNFDFEGL